MAPSGTGTPGVIDPLNRALLVAISQSLVERNERTSLVRLCALWAEQEPLPVYVALDEARALLDLRLMDLAWVRLRELDKTQRHRVEVQSLTAEMFIERGWPGRARRILDRAVMDYPERADLKVLLERSMSSPLRPPSNARSIEREGSKEEQLALAERYLCAGSQLKARSILKRLRRGKSSQKARVEELLWGLDTDLEAETCSLMELAQGLSSQLPLVEDAPLEQTLEGLTSAEVTTRGPLPQELEERADPNFPSLFRWVDDSGDFKGEQEEVTRISSLSELKAQRESETEWDDEDENDTKVIRVLHHDAKGTPTLIEELESPDTDSESLPSGLAGLENDVHTSSFTMSDMDFETDSEFLEEEDAGLIVMTRRESTGSVPDSEDTLGPMELIERVPPGPEEVEGFEATDPTVPEANLSRKPPAPKRRRRPPPSSKRGQKRVFFAVVFMLGSLIAGLVGWKTIQSKKHDAILVQSLTVIAGGDYQALLREEARLSHALDQGLAKPIGAHLAAYGLVELSLWGDYSGGRERWEAAVQAIRDAGLYGASVEARGLSASTRAFFQGDLESAEASLRALDYKPAAAALLAARVALRKGKMKRAMSFVDQALEMEPSHVSSLLTKADLCIRELDADCARDTIEKLESNSGPLGPTRLLRIRLDSMDEVAVDRAGIIEQALASGLDLSPRQVGRVRVRLAQLYALDGDMVSAQRAFEAALAADSESASARFGLGAFRLREGRVKQALSDFRACVRSRPADQDCHSGVVHSLLELDRVEEARLHVLGHEPVLGAGGARERFAAWLDYAGEEDPGTIANHLVFRGPREKYILGLSHGRAGRSALAESTLIEAAEGLHGSGNSLDLWMAPRAFAAAARFGESEYREGQAERAMQIGGSDPMVLVDLGWYRDSIGQTDEAVALFDLADGVGSESALAHFNRGWYFLDFGDNQTRTKASWIRYRDLSPSGTRAERTMSQLLELY